MIKMKMKLLVAAQALGRQAVPADPVSFYSDSPCTTSIRKLIWASDAPLISLELSQLPPTEAWMLESCYSSSHMSRESVSILTHNIQRLMQK